MLKTIPVLLGNLPNKDIGVTRFRGVTITARFTVKWDTTKYKSPNNYLLFGWLRPTETDSPAHVDALSGPAVAIRPLSEGSARNILVVDNPQDLPQYIVAEDTVVNDSTTYAITGKAVRNFIASGNYPIEANTTYDLRITITEAHAVSVALKPATETAWTEVVDSANFRPFNELLVTNVDAFSNFGFIAYIEDDATWFIEQLNIVSNQEEYATILLSFNLETITDNAELQLVLKPGSLTDAFDVYQWNANEASWEKLIESNTNIVTHTVTKNELPIDTDNYWHILVRTHDTSSVTVDGVTPAHLELEQAYIRIFPPVEFSPARYDVFVNLMAYATEKTYTITHEASTTRLYWQPEDLVLIVQSINNYPYGDQWVAIHENPYDAYTLDNNFRIELSDSLVFEETLNVKAIVIPRETVEALQALADKNKTPGTNPRIRSFYPAVIGPDARVAGGALSEPYVVTLHWPDKIVRATLKGRPPEGFRFLVVG